MEMEVEGVSIGIDLGTSYSCISCWRNGGVEIIPNSYGNRISPTYIAFGDDNHTVGDIAKNLSASNAGNTVFKVNRFIERRFDDSVVQSDLKFSSFKVAPAADGTPLIQVTVKDQEKHYSAEDILSMILCSLKEQAEAYLSQPVGNVVITVPANHSHGHRRFMHRAANIAGLKDVRIVSGPCAAMLTLGVNHSGEERNTLIFDLGGGSLDVAVATLYEDAPIEIAAVAGDNHLGGEDFDTRLVSHFALEFTRISGKDISGNQRAVRRLRTACERAKRALSTSFEAYIHIDALLDGVDFHSTITRAVFEQLNEDLFHRCMNPVEQLLRNSKLSKSEIHEIVLIGGSTRIPKIQQLLSEFFDGKVLNNSLNPDETAASGAVLYALQVRGSALKDIYLLDVIPMPLCVSEKDSSLSLIAPAVIKRNYTIPAKKWKPLSTCVDNQSAVLIKIFEGDCAVVEDSTLLGSIYFDHIPPMPKGEPQIHVTFDLDILFNLRVSVVEPLSGRELSLCIDCAAPSNRVDPTSGIVSALAGNKNQRLLDTSRRGSLSDVLELIADGANVNTKTYDGWEGALCFECVQDWERDYTAGSGSKKATVVKKVVAEVNDSTPLHLAVKAGHGEIVRTLLDAGADASLRNKAGICPKSLTRNKDILKMFQPTTNERTNLWARFNIFSKRKTSLDEIAVPLNPTTATLDIETTTLSSDAASLSHKTALLDHKAAELKNETASLNKDVSPPSNAVTSLIHQAAPLDTKAAKLDNEAIKACNETASLQNEISSLN